MVPTSKLKLRIASRIGYINGRIQNKFKGANKHRSVLKEASAATAPGLPPIFTSETLCPHFQHNFFCKNSLNFFLYSTAARQKKFLLKFWFREMGLPHPE